MPFIASFLRGQEPQDEEVDVKVDEEGDEGLSGQDAAICIQKHARRKLVQLWAAEQGLLATLGLAREGETSGAALLCLEPCLRGGR